MNPVLFALDLHIVACGLLSWFCLCMDGGIDDTGREEDSGVPRAGS
ncbi:hypothetical protein SEA_SHAM4_62 [Mycobacterium phage Sham4]|nr:hypothetical protein BJD74_gp47 [Mycobacterium phage Mulciber]AQT28280.1 hypothetical protein SEA_JABITH_63 [Mycobacterium phage Jabith]ASR86699.1 hypothetical protein SEA_ET2BRUTUS_61 [Mycobacterium phage Et2Brutus]AXC33421.1 hypothetical protein SEA_EBONY_62 [Mycobacterium phage Ebony]AXC33521.1 hypothetical protein SEA_JOSELITO_63 [Mycobacterium phage Joselito]AXH50741.1 hypothetical protein SEA_SNAPE_62 [Mycobacterium phage Snape]QBI97891.1 hypothetical protein SEA_ORANGE_61 [Mycobacte